MTNWNELNNDEKIAAIQKVAGIKHIPPQAVEKDLWVTIILQLVYTLPFADKIVFKGGTSLSKVFGKIDRFSEDIDLALDRTLFNMTGDVTKKQLKQLRKTSSLFVNGMFFEELQKVAAAYGYKDLVFTVEPNGEGDRTYPEPRKIFIEYKSLFRDTLDYIKPRVMLEIGARSLIEPTVQTQIQSLIEMNIPDLSTSGNDPQIITSVIEKTFLEKAFLLHELFSTGAKAQANRRSRHLYDLEKMMDEPFAADAIQNDELWESISHHRQVFTSMADVDYTPDIRKRIVLVPPKDCIADWKEDYDAMRSTMIFGESPTFDQLMVRISVLEKRFHDTGNGTGN